MNTDKIGEILNKLSQVFVCYSYLLKVHAIETKIGDTRVVTDQCIYKILNWSVS